MFSRLTALAGLGGASLPFELGEQQPCHFGSWQHYRGTARADGAPVSVWRLAAPSKSDARLEAGRHGVKRLRMTRHPGVLGFKDSLEVEEKGEAVLYLVTEPVTPLAEVLRGMAGTDREQYLGMGLSSVVGALSFLANDCALIHGAVSMAAVVVTQTLDWKLAHFDLVSEHQFASQYDLPLAAAAWLLPAQYKAGEVAKGDWQAVKDGPAWAVDAWGLGCLMQEVYSGAPLARTEDLRNTDRIPKDLLPHYQRLLASQPARRLNPRAILEAGVLRNRLAEAASFLESLAIKDTMEKDAFFKKLPGLLPSIPTLVAQRKLLPMLASAIEFGGAPPAALTTLLAIGKTLPEEEQTKQVVPILTKLFASSDRGIRRGLLENIASYGPALPDKVVEDQIYNNVAAGFTDANPYLRELTLKSMAVLGPKLSQKTLTQSLLKHLAKLQVDEEASIRANTTVLLGNLAPNLSEATCKKVLLNAFTRALRDGFPPARVAGLKAIVATDKYHGPEDAATRVLPAVGPLCVDAVHEVRASALACVQHFTKVLVEHNKVLERQAAAMAESEGAGAASRGGAAAPGSSGGASLLNSFGWAVSNLGLGRGGAPDAAAKPAAAAAPPAAAAAAAAAASAQAPAPAAAGAAVSRGGSGAPAAPAAAAAGNGWDNEDDGWEDMDSGNAELEARQRLTKLGMGGSGAAASRTRPTAAAAPAAARPAAVAPAPAAAAAKQGGGEGWGDDDDGPHSDLRTT
ncbi:putative inactive serine threonine- kinase scy1 isoform X1 [Chlorella sorokiniana]|uniref:Inactive serine threonine-kinase scy1 isoform X1 n=1 Tax=Chlorella sorokiniana TaxID=3076 RepID=A0A2P6U4H4_CHLSO|nr:putative inactive serine threonine- kinase scy1 isoform X1 [Chlorella sorokiniana]|eukprot:PRW61211.1 putative inactive serine threonine- kinase scy1 isoform X1 [Chlorella sorokiniana]